MSATPLDNFYSDPGLYHLLHLPGTRQEVAGLVRLFHRYSIGPIPKRPTWLEPFSGTGRYLLAAASRGIHGIGIDAEPRMIAYARELSRKVTNRPRSGRLQFHVAPAESIADVVRPGSVDFAFAPINSIRHIESDRALLRHLEGVATALKPGGVYAVGLSLANYENDVEEEDTWTATRGRLSVTMVSQYLPPERGGRFESVIVHVTKSRPTGEEHHDFRYRLRTYDARQWRMVLRKSPFNCEAFVDGSGEALDSLVFRYGTYVLRRGHVRKSSAGTGLAGGLKPTHR